MQYFWLSAAFWMLVQAINLHAVTVIVLGLNMEKRLMMYRIIGWGIPAIIVLATVLGAGHDKYGGESL